MVQKLKLATQGAPFIEHSMSTMHLLKYLLTNHTSMRTITHCYRQRIVYNKATAGHEDRHLQSWHSEVEAEPF